MSRQDSRGLEDIIKPDNANGFQTPETEPEPVQPETPKQAYPSREGKVPVQFFLNEDAHLQLKMMAVERRMTNQDIMIVALNAWFLMNDKPPFA